ncbi:MAG: S8 family serine peptidase, partial [candidate division WOR-3 bacterium]
SPLTRLNALVSSDLGTTWQPGNPPVADALTMGSYTVASSANGQEHDWTLLLLYESGGFIHRRSTANPDLSNWSEPELVDTTGFGYSPTLASLPQTMAAVWFKRGDDNAVWESSDTLRFSRDQSDHGTRMTSLIAGWLPYTLIGIAPAVDLLIAKTEFYKSRGNRYYEYNIEEDTYIAALEWAEAMGADIVSTSLGYRGWYRSDQFDGRTAPVSIAAAMAARRGLLICTAMGNRDSTRYPWPQPYIVAPGDADGVITCGGVQRSGLPWRGTGTGPTSDGRTKPDFVALSDTVAVASPEPATDTSSLLDGSAGTSCATALIAGVCALIKEAHPSWNAESIITALRLTSTRSVPSCTFGYGVPRVDSVFRIFPPDRQAQAIARDEIGLIFPNPFVPQLHQRVYFALSLANPTPRASIAVYTAGGALVDTIPLHGDLLTRPGRYGHQGDIATLEQLGAYWDGRNNHGQPVAAGLYLAVLRTTFGRSTTRFAIVR